MEYPIDKGAGARQLLNQPQLAIAGLKAIKPHVQLSIAMPVLVGMVTTVQRLPAGVEWLILLSVFFFYSGAISAFNDYLDQKRDAINHPDRLLVSGRISPARYLTVFVGLFVLISLILLASITSTSTFFRLTLIFVLIELLHLLYGWRPDLGFKGFGRQSLLCIGAILLVLFGSLALGSPPAQLVPVALAVGLFVGFGIIGKDIADTIGDSASGLVTIPIHFGPTMAGWISATGHIPAFALVAWLTYQGALAEPAIPFFIIAAAMVAFSCAYLIRGKYGPYWGIPMLVGFTSQLVFQLGIILGVTAS
jgi:4-hydroxybenzoate polyprenyltransferase